MASARRSLCFPLYRHWQLTQRVLQDVREILLLGRHAVLKAMLVRLGGLGGGQHLLNFHHPRTCTTFCGAMMARM